MENIIQEQEAEGRLGTVNTYRSALNRLIAFIGDSKDLTFEDITGRRINLFYDFLQRSGIANNSIRLYIRILRTVYNRAVKEEIPGTRLVSPFGCISISETETIKRAISLDFINAISLADHSKATNINSTWYALESMESPVVWIVGGKDKGNDYSELMDLVKEKVKAIVCLGVDNSKIHAAFDGAISLISDATSMEEAVKQSYKYAIDGDVVLLSPACASFDLFQNYEDRGRQFKEAVRNL